MKDLTKQQSVQEEQYCFPYHYLELYFELYRDIEHRQYLSLLKANKDMLKPFIGQKILDAGCGDGRFCYELRNENAEVLGIDYSERAIRFAKAFNTSSQFCVADLTSLSYENCFDIVTMVEVLEHIPPEKIKDCIASLARALKPGGKLLVSVPSVNIPVHAKHYQHFTVESLFKLFEDKFILVSKQGHTKAGKEWQRYMRKVRLAHLLWPARKKIPLIHRFLDHVKKYFDNIRECEPQDCCTIILLLEKKT